ncbi:MAG: 3-hydroxyacyl-[acyl-carrier-protein] dehydratase FabZ [Alphaproteobacteria bacterium]|nr:3-hydroxyacyl-[acyl-carrier-protein] dehydratase FabZ [Alphaproteobacteria bacterium]NDC57178.1 3-hydroxyacyl-[acyl-carrier-protein] dehydratase FabZ [Alphaproteobacteria bacterium]NDG05200.1 3-hydroxyacyl-[acyl-carrier-protein] dehydratase FabZ [Alphaproteobacteria bacterium]
MTDTKTLDINQILSRIPHRYPMLLIDAITDIVPGVSGTGIKNVTMNEPFFMGHFPGRPIMPGVLIIEAMAQTSATLVVDDLHHGQPHNDLVYFMMIESARFRKPVVPGDTLRLKCVRDRQRGNVWRFKCDAFVNDGLVAEAMITAMLAPEKENPKAHD